jgi:hypothetical protein
MKGKLLNITIQLPSFTRYVASNYYDLATKIRVGGGNPWTVGDLRILFDDLDDVRIATNKGFLVFHYEDETIRFDFYNGFAYNTASVPDILKFAKDNDDFDMMVMSLPHDGGYIGKQMSKPELDKLFVDGIEYFHDKEDSDGFFGAIEDLKENAIECAIEIAFDTDAAMESWNKGIELTPKSHSMMTVVREEKVS